MKLTDRAARDAGQPNDRLQPAQIAHCAGRGRPDLLGQAEFVSRSVVVDVMSPTPE